MKKNLILTCVILAAFCLGFGAKSLLPENAADFKKVTGIGGIFFKAKDPKKMRAWYQENLGLKVNPYGSVFEWRQAPDGAKKGYSQWSVFPEKTKYFEPSAQNFMINYRVDNMDKLVAQLKKDGVTITDTVQSYDYGKFVHILDLEGNKIELWEPNDVAYEKMGVDMGAETTK